MPRRLLLGAVLLAAAGGGLFWLVTRPQPLDPALLDGLQPGDAQNGERIFHLAGCASCHAPPGAEGGARLSLAGGHALKTPFGTFVAPNISPHVEDGIGGWDVADFANAVMRGISPQGAHYYPAFPYTSYARMEVQDVADLFAYLKTLPPVAGRADGHTLSFPYTVRRGIGLWKRLHLDAAPVVEFPAGAPEEVLRGRYLVEGPGHCGECHTPRSLDGGLDTGRWLAGAPSLEGEGTVPDITPSADGLGAWSPADIVYYFETGFTPDFDSVGGTMVAVQENLARLPDEDRQAIAAYLKAIPSADR